ncbi:hypothetical protein PIB30_035414 [Stylosanthes scabra]|uniref:Uncharacterized protein n=1 Tax=Stylosanthes scabra TaxID=79078 RepID=A0ABU6QDR8_9FABA|nr:hypothetical protein [Stylosanthes scabra]
MTRAASPQWIRGEGTGTSALGSGDSRIDPVIARTLKSLFGPGYQDRPGDRRLSGESWAGSLTPTQHLHLCEFELGIVGPFASQLDTQGCSENDPSPILGIWLHPCDTAFLNGDRAKEKAFNHSPIPSSVTSHSDPGSLLFDPEIERTLRQIRQARRRAELAKLALNNNPFYSSDSSSDSDTQSSSSV